MNATDASNIEYYAGADKEIKDLIFITQEMLTQIHDTFFSVHFPRLLHTETNTQC